MTDLDERRLVRRHSVNVPLKYRLWKSQLPEMRGESLDISESGVYFAAHSVLEKGETVEVRFEMPEGVVDEPPAEWLCTGQVMRVDRVGGLSGRLGVAVRFDCYEIAKPQGTTTFRVDQQSFRLGFFSRPAGQRPDVRSNWGPQGLAPKRRGLVF
jgi:hypothetical protein